jgi:4-hydroxy-tetrahydrodipicolinate synthase
MRRHFSFLIDNGVHGLVTCGSLGEASTLSLEEKLAVAKTAVEAGRGRIPVLANVSRKPCRTCARSPRRPESPA